MKDSIYLIFSKEGIVAMRKTLPELKSGQYATRIDVLVDDKYFKRIIPIAKMELDDKFLIEPKMVLEPMEKPDDTPQGEEISESTIMKGGQEEDGENHSS
jgi:hypothetical protein